MSARAAEMARLMMEEWPDNESAESFALRRFPKDTIKNLEIAVAILDEMEKADNPSPEGWKP